MNSPIDENTCIAEYLRPNVDTELLQGLETYVEEAKGLTSHGYSEACLNTSRKYLEKFVFSMARNSGKEFKKDAFNEALSFVRKNGTPQLPVLIYHYMKHIQNIGNFASHDQLGVGGPSIEDAIYCVYMIEEITDWYRGPANHSSLEEDFEFAREVHLAVRCTYCGSEIGNKCIGKTTGSVWKNRLHRDREKAYASYRRQIQKLYPKTIADYMHDMVKEIGLEDVKTVNVNEIKEWFDKHYPAYNPISVGSHANMMAVNLRTRLSHNLRGDEKYNLFYSLGRGNFRLFDPNTDSILTE